MPSRLGFGVIAAALSLALLAAITVAVFAVCALTTRWVVGQRAAVDLAGNPQDHSQTFQLIRALNLSENFSTRVLRDLGIGIPNVDSRTINSLSRCLANAIRFSLIPAIESCSELVNEESELELEQLREQLRRIRDQERNLEQEQERLNERSRGVVGRFDLIRDDLADLLSLPLEGASPGTEPSTTYTDGVLSGLPVIPRVPDGLKTNRDLASVVEDIVGLLPQRPASEAAGIAKRLQDLREATQQALAEKVSIQEALATVIQLKVALEDQKLTVRQGLLRIVRESIFRLTEFSFTPWLSTP